MCAMQVYGELNAIPARESAKPVGAPEPLKWDITPAVKEGERAWSCLL